MPERIRRTLCIRCNEPIPEHRGRRGKPVLTCSDACSKARSRDTEGKVCSVADCGRPVRARGLCVTDYVRWWRAINGSEPYVHTPAQVDKYHRRRAAMYGTQKGDPVNHLAIYERDGWQCGICKRPVDRDLVYPDPMSASLDHVTPIAHGGLHDPSNVQLAHLLCNIDKGASLLV